MSRLVMFATVMSLTACAQKKEAPVGQPGSAASVVREAPAGSAAPTAPGPGSTTSTPPPSDGADEVAQLVVHDVGSKALGNQTIEASCVSVVLMPSGDWTVAAASLKGCGDKTARSILWLYKRNRTGKWNEDYVGQPPKCWKGVPADIADAVRKATKIPSC